MGKRLFRFVALAILLSSMLAKAQVIGVEPTSYAVYGWDATNNQWATLRSASTAEPYSNTPQAVSFAGFNASLGQWVPIDTLPITGSGAPGAQNPVPVCTVPQYGKPYWDQTNHFLHLCGPTGWYLYNPGGGGGGGSVDAVANIAALKAYSGTSSVVFVLGYYSASMSSPPDGGGGIFNDTGAAQFPILSLTSVANASSFTTTYTGSSLGACATNACVGQVFNIVGFSNSANNGAYDCTASTSTTITLDSPYGVAETHAATGTPLSTDDGGVTILDTATGHVWKRQITTPGDAYSAWFGVRSNTSVSYDNCVQAQNAINYTSRVGGSNFETYTHGRLNWQSGLIQHSCALVEPETPQWNGAGMQVPGRGGTELQYTGASTPNILFNGAGFSSTMKKITNMTFSTDLSHPTTKTDAWEVDGSYHPAGGSFQFQEGSLDTVGFKNITGAAIYYHVSPPATALATFTGYISDGTGAAPGAILCVTAGSVLGNYYLSGAGIPANTYVIRPLDSVTAPASWAKTCTGPGGGLSYLISNSPNTLLSLNISSETMTQGFVAFPYAQEDMWSNLQLSSVGSFLRTDYSPGTPMNNVLKILNLGLENGIQFGAGLENDFADFSNFAKVRVENFVYDGSGPSNPHLFGCPSDTAVFQGVYVEQGTSGAKLNSVFDFSIGHSGGLCELDYSYLGGATDLNQGYATFEPYTIGAKVITDNSPSPSTSSYTQVGNAIQNSVEITHSSMPGFQSTNMISVDRYDLAGTRCASTNDGQGCNLSVPQSVPFVDLHGAWLDGLNAGIVSFSVSGVASEGLVTDANEGRVFEMVGTAAAQPTLTATLNNIPADLRGQQVTATYRWKFHTTTAGYVMCPLQQSMARGTGTGGIFNECTSGIYLPDTWYTTYAVGYLPNAGSPTFQAITAIGSPSLGGGTVTYDVSAVHIEAGVNIPVMIVGGNPAQPIEWRAAAAPTYGTYVVGDHVINSAPASGQPQGWICTTAPSTWTAQPNL